MVLSPWLQGLRRPWVTVGVMTCLLVASRWMLPHATVCHPQSLASLEAPGELSVWKRPLGSFHWLEVNGGQVRLGVEGSCGASGDVTARLEPDGRLRLDNPRQDDPLGLVLLRTDGWGRPSSLYVEKMVYFTAEGYESKVAGTAPLELPLDCGPRPFWVPPGRTISDCVALLLFEMTPSWKVLWGLLFGLCASLLEARAARVMPWGRLWAVAALSVRVLLPVAAMDAFIDALGGGWNTRASWLNEGAGVGRHPLLLLPLGCLGLGQVLAAAGVAFRREDHPTGAFRAAPSVPVLLGLTAVLGLVLRLRVDPGLARGWEELFPLYMVSVWGLFYLSVPVLLGALLPGKLRRRLTLAGIATVLFLLGHLLVGSNTLLRLFHVFRGLEAWTKLEPAQILAALELQLFAWTALTVVLAAAALTVSLHTRRSALIRSS